MGKKVVNFIINTVTKIKSFRIIAKSVRGRNIVYNG